MPHIFFFPNIFFRHVHLVPPKALWLVDCFYTGRSPDLRESPRQSPTVQKQVKGGDGRCLEGLCASPKDRSGGGIPHPQLCEAANLRKAGFWQKRSVPRG